AAEQGLLQGAERFRGLAALLALAGCGKVVPAVAVLAAGGGVGAALTAGAVGVAAVWVGALAWTARAAPPTWAPAPSSSFGSLIEHRSAASHHPGVRTVIAAGQVQLVMMALTSVDLIVARALLSPEEAGRYALGAVAAKAAFWLPQAVGTVLYPRMADPAGHRGAVRSAVAVLLGIGAVVVVTAAVATPLVPAVVGEAYRPAAGLLWAVAALGVALSILQAFLLDTTASDRTAEAALALAGVAQAYRPVAGLLWALAALGVVHSVLQAFLLATIASDRTVEAAIAWAGRALTAAAAWAAPREVEAVLAATLAVVAVTTLAAGWRALRPLRPH